MRTRVREHTRHLAGFVVLALALGACGGGGGGPTGPDPNAPVITDLQVRALTPERANTRVRYLITVAVQDRDNDLAGGHVEVREQTSGQVVSATIAPPVTNPLVFTLETNPLLAGRYNLAVTVIDAAGHRSNSVPFSVTINPQVRQDGIPEMQRPGSIIDSLTPARR